MSNESEVDSEHSENATLKCTVVHQSIILKVIKQAHARSIFYEWIKTVDDFQNWEQ